MKSDLALTGLRDAVARVDAAREKAPSRLPTAILDFARLVRDNAALTAAVADLIEADAPCTNESPKPRRRCSAT